MQKAIGKNAKASRDLKEYEVQVLSLLKEHNMLLRESNTILKKDHESIVRIEDYTRSIRFNTNTIR